MQTQMVEEFAKARETCRQCGKQIAAMPVAEAICCACRYGSNSATGYVDHHAELDCVEWMNQRVPVRLAEARRAGAFGY